MPEGDTILWAAMRMRPVLEGHVPDSVRMPEGRPSALRGSPGRRRWPQRLEGRRVLSIDTHGKNLFIRFGPPGDELVLHSHLRMTGSWGIYGPGRPWRRASSRAWIVFSRAGQEVASIIDGARPRMLRSGTLGFRHARLQCYRRVGQPCPRCAAAIRSRAQGEGNRMTYWCPACQR